MASGATSNASGVAPPNPRATLLSLVEEHLSHLIREADCIKRHCKRARIHQTSKDDYRGVIRRRLHADDINLALQWRGSEKLYATGTVVPVSDDANSKPVELEDYLKSEMQLRPPPEVGLTVHWLAVDGQQPELPQNPTRSSAILGLGGVGAGGGNKNRSNVVESDTAATALDGPDSSNGVRVSQLLPLLLSEELQLYFTRITLAIQRGGATPTTRQQQDAALSSVARDVGLQELLPFFTKYISQELNHHVGNPDHCRTLIRLALSMLQNPHLHLELHVSLTRNT
jgi:transcription initiation factor TFIID subunit 6